MSTQKPNLWGLLSDAARVIKSHSLHFLALATLFLLPVSIFSIIYPFFGHQSSIPPSLHRSLIFVSPPADKSGIFQTGNSQFLVSILYVTLVLLFFLSATASITHSALCGFYGKPVRFISSLKSILVSILPLLATNVVLGLIFALIGLVVGILTFLTYNALTSLGVIMDYDSGYFVVYVILMVALIILASLYLQVEWFLCMVVVVVEAKWGLQPLKRSSYLVKGMRGIVVSIILLFAIPGVLLSLWYYNVIKSIAAGGISWSSIVLLIVYAVIVTILSLYSTVAHTILYAYCKARHGEMVLENDEEAGIEYARLPGSDDKEI